MVLLWVVLGLLALLAVLLIVPAAVAVGISRESLAD